MERLLRQSAEQNVLDKQKIENQRRELKQFNEKRNEVAKLRTMLKAEKDKIVDSTKMSSDLERYKKQINDLEAMTQEYENRIPVCTICFEDYNEKRPQVAFGPCGHSTCSDCNRKLPKIEVDRRRVKLCPICRRQIQKAIPLFVN